MRMVSCVRLRSKTDSPPGPDLTWRQYMCHVTNQSDTIFIDNLRALLQDRLESEKTVKTIEDLGLLSDETIVKKGTPIDTVNVRSQVYICRPSEVADNSDD